VLQDCNVSVPRKLQNHHKSVARVSQGYHKCVTRVTRVLFTQFQSIGRGGATKVLQEC
jgi:hypothetical protein